MQGITCDLPCVEPLAKEFFDSVGMKDRLKFHGFDFFKDEFPKGDAVIFCHTMYNWPNETKDMLMRKAVDAIPVGGVVMVIEMFMDNERSKDVNPVLFSLNMVYVTEGHCSTKKEMSGFMERHGLKSIAYSQICNNGIMIGFKEE